MALHAPGLPFGLCFRRYLTVRLLFQRYSRLSSLSSYGALYLLFAVDSCSPHVAEHRNQSQSYPGFRRRDRYAPATLFTSARSDDFLDAGGGDSVEQGLVSAMNDSIFTVRLIVDASQFGAER